MAEIPDKIGRYEVVSVLGRGAMGVVYKAKDAIIDRMVAVKRFSAALSTPLVQKEEYYERFFMEAKAVGRLKHPNIVTLYDVGEEEGVPFMAMELIDGGSLASLMKGDGGIALERSISLVRQVASGLEHAHAHGIVHRDIKPANVLIDEGDRAVITDFGVARLAESDVTRSGEVLGTPHYMSPEQILGEELDGRSDLFSLGVVFYFLLSGRKPFKGETLTTICYHIVNSLPEPFQPELGLPIALTSVVEQMLAKSKDDRFQSMGDFIKALNAASGTFPGGFDGEGTATTDMERVANSESDTVKGQHPTMGVSSPPIPAPGPSTGRRWLWIGILGGAGLITVLLFLFLLVGWFIHEKRSSVVTAPEAKTESADVPSTIETPAPSPDHQDATPDVGTPTRKVGEKAAATDKRALGRERRSSKTAAVGRERRPSKTAAAGAARWERKAPLSAETLKLVSEIEGYTRRSTSAASNKDFTGAFNALDDGEKRLQELELSGSRGTEESDRAKAEMRDARSNVEKKFAAWAGEVISTAESTYAQATDSFNDDEDGIIESYVQLWPVLKYKSHLPGTLSARADKLVKNCRENLGEDEWARAKALATGKPIPDEDEDEDDG